MDKTVEEIGTKNYILLVVTVAVVSAVAGYFLQKNYLNKIQEPQQKACTQEAKLCPDGSSVGRTGPNCEFTPCPTIAKFSTVCTTATDCIATCPHDCLNKEAAKLGQRAACLVKPTHSCQCVDKQCKPL